MNLFERRIARKQREAREREDMIEDAKALERLNELNNKSRGKLGDKEIRLDVINLESNHYYHYDDEDTARAKLSKESEQWRTKLDIFVHPSNYSGNKHAQAVEFIGYRIIPSRDVGHHALYITDKGQFVYIINRRIIAQGSSLEEVAKILVEHKHYDFDVYDIFDKVGKRHLLTRPLPEGKYMDIGPQSEPMVAPCERTNAEKNLQ